ncbi:MAG: CinA family protein [Streptomycetaceae bacterium]|nr:MAG: CinA family protein [Streptomycetaceae bacterium]
MNTQSAASSIVDALRSRGEKLSVAESLTGGGLASAISAIPGASDIFLGGIVAYSNSLKESLLHVSSQDIEQFGVVSQEVAAAMAEGALHALGTQWAISTTGVAGPGSHEGVPAGHVWIAICGPVRQRYFFELPGGREEVRKAAISSALTAFSRILSTLDMDKNH